MHWLLFLSYNSPTEWVQLTFKTPQYLYGFVALAALTLLCMAGLNVVRRNFFQLFVYAHALLALVFYIFSLLHASNIIIKTIVPLALYGIDALVRLRALKRASVLSACVLAAPLPPTNPVATIPIQGSDNAVAISNNERQYVELKVVLPQFHPAVAPGQYFNLLLPSLSLTQLHPFSVASIELIKSRVPVEGAAISKSDPSVIEMDQTGTASPSPEAAQVAASANDLVCKLVIQANGDFTKALAALCAESALPSGSVALLDGPYGSFHLRLQSGVGALHGVAGGIVSPRPIVCSCTFYLFIAVGLHIVARPSAELTSVQ